MGILSLVWEEAGGINFDSCNFCGGVVEMSEDKLSDVRYPELESILHQYPNPEILLGHEIFWQEKRDGSNIGVRLFEDNTVRIRSRNMAEASEDILKAYVNTDEASKIYDLLIDLKQNYNTNAVLFGELLLKGKSPTRAELHEKTEFVAFDMWIGDGFIPYTLFHQFCYHFNVPIVELWGTSRHTTIESLLKFRDKMLEIAKQKGREGTVGKMWDKFMYKEGNKTFKYFKEKLDTPKLEKLPREMDNGTIILPNLPESEITGALEKVLTDVGFINFRDKRIAMPLFARYVADECTKHNCINKSPLFTYYNLRLQEMKEEIVR